MKLFPCERLKQKIMKSTYNKLTITKNLTEKLYRVLSNDRMNYMRTRTYALQTDYTKTVITCTESILSNL